MTLRPLSALICDFFSSASVAGGRCCFAASDPAGQTRSSGRRLPRNAHRRTFAASLSEKHKHQHSDTDDHRERRRLRLNGASHLPHSEARRATTPRVGKAVDTEG